MNRETMIALAREAGVQPIQEFALMGAWVTNTDAIQRFAALVAQRERQAILEYIEESLGSEDKRNPHLAEGFNWGLDYIETFIRDRNK